MKLVTTMEYSPSEFVQEIDIPLKPIHVIDVPLKPVCILDIPIQP